MDDQLLCDNIDNVSAYPYLFESVFFWGRCVCGYICGLVKCVCVYVCVYVSQSYMMCCFVDITIAVGCERYTWRLCRCETSTYLASSPTSPFSFCCIVATQPLHLPAILFLLYCSYLASSPTILFLLYCSYSASSPTSHSLPVVL